MSERDNLFESCACPLCGSDDPAATPWGAAPYRVVRCGGCAAWYLSPRLSEAAVRDFYARADYFGGGAVGYSGYDDEAESLRRTFRGVIRGLAGRGLTGGDLLEVGCGHGYFLEQAAGAFRTRTGTELSADAAAAARARADTVVVGGLEALPERPSFDLIAAFHVIEHIYDPREFVRSALRRLRPGGALVLAAPDMGGWWRRVLGPRWPSFKFPEHVVFYDSDTLPRLMREEGLGEPFAVPYPHAFSLAAVGGKLGLPVPAAARRWPIPIPGTTICYGARVAGGAESS